MSIKTYLGFDVGTKRTGVAIANSLTRTASGIAVVNNNKDGSTNFQGFDEIINSYNVNLFIIGLAFDKHNKAQEMTFIAKSFGRRLSNRYNIKAVFIDEYLSSSDAKKQLKYDHHHARAKRGEVDKLSAQLILQSWLEDRSKP